MAPRSADSPTSTASSSHQSSSSQQHSNKKEAHRRGGGCCGCACWFWIIVLLLGLGLIAGGVTWYLLPEETKEDLLTRGTQAPTASPSPTLATTISWRYHQCAEDSGGVNCCQGLDNGTCNLKVNQLLYGYVHNAVHTVEDGFLLPWNQEYGLEKALAAGFRAFELDVGRCGDDEQVVFFHSRCALGTRDPTTVLKAIGDFVQANPTEIVILLLQMPDQDVVTLAQFDHVLQGVPSVANHLYAHPAAGIPWPTLQELINADERIILFFMNQPNCRTQVCPASGVYHYWDDFAVETEWDFRSIEQIDDTDYSCAANHVATGIRRDFYRVNAFTSLPSKTVSKQVNTYAYAQSRMAACATIQGQNVNFYAVDYWNQGQVLQLVQDVNRQRAQQYRQQKQEKEEQAAAAAAATNQGNRR